MKMKIEDPDNVVIEDENIQEVEKLVYLGCEVRKDGNIRNEVGTRIGKAGAELRII